MTVILIFNYVNYCNRRTISIFMMMSPADIKRYYTPSLVVHAKSYTSSWRQVLEARFSAIDPGWTRFKGIAFFILCVPHTVADIKRAHHGCMHRISFLDGIHAAVVLSSRIQVCYQSRWEEFRWAEEGFKNCSERCRERYEAGPDNWWLVIQPERILQRGDSPRGWSAIEVTDLLAKSLPSGKQTQYTEHLQLAMQSVLDDWSIDCVSAADVVSALYTSCRLVLHDLR